MQLREDMHMQRKIKHTRDTAPSETQALKDLLAMLRTMRPAYSKTDERFIKEWITPLGVDQDKEGNLFKLIGEAKRSGAVLWSSHTDTVHWKDGPQRIERCGDLIQLAKNERRATCLGADCTTGVWIMREMILASVPGLYVFHRGEECGGIGSRYIAENLSYLFEDYGIQFAIAFDRAGKNSVITYQGGTRTASDAFAASIAEQLPGVYVADDGGIFTDTANYDDLVPECSNLSVGYEHAHTKRETQSISHALALRAAMLKIDTSQFVCERDPSVVDDLWAKWHENAALIDGPWFERDEIQEEIKVGNELWVKRNGDWYRADEPDDSEEEGEASDYLNGWTYYEEEEEDPLRFGDWSPPKDKW